jgi:hypothetical protein
MRNADHEPGARPTQLVLLATRATMEGSLVAAFAWWGWRHGGSTTGSVVWAVATPALGFGVWGAIDFRRAGSMGELLRLVEELVLTALAAAALLDVGQGGLAIALAALSLVYHVAVYATGARLLKTVDGSV